VGILELPNNVLMTEGDTCLWNLKTGELLQEKMADDPQRLAPITTSCGTLASNAVYLALMTICKN
jgi:hypothetical protein